MPTCKNCGRDMGFFGKVGEPCSECKRKEKVPEIVEVDDEASKVMLTTETAPSFEIFERIEIVTAECAYGMNIFKDLFSGVRDIVGGRSTAIQKTMRDARRTVLMELKREAYAVGANAVVGVDLDYVELSGAGNMVMLVASGTAVRAKF